MEKYVVNASGKLLAFTEETVTRPGEPGSGAERSSWSKADVAGIALYDAAKVSAGRVATFGLIGALAKRTDVMITFALADGTMRSFKARKANPAEIAMALRLRGWPVT